MNSSIENWFKVLNQVLELIIKLPGQYQLKNIHVIFTNMYIMVENVVHQTI